MFATAVTVEDWVRQGAAYFENNSLFFGHGTSNALDEAAWLVCWASNIAWEDLDASLSIELAKATGKKIENLFIRRVEERLPAAYLIGEAWFAGLKFKVNEQVLVPRSPLAELIQKQFQPWLSSSPKKILDLCCGSGCIGLACASYLENVQVLLSDISDDALKVAQENVETMSMASRVSVLKSDAFENISGKFDLIISNPPYVDAEDFANMPDEFKAEPEIGLVSGKDGLDFTRELLKTAANYLNEGGTLIVEVGNSAEALENLMPQVPFIWPEFEFGGHGVFILNRIELLKYKADIENI